MRRHLIPTLIIIALLASCAAVVYAAEKKACDKLEEPLPYRIISFHQGKVDKEMVDLAHKIGYNGVMIQLEGANVPKVEELAELDKKENIFDYCHNLGMEVTIWVHELSEIPGPESPDYMGPITLDNEKLWAFLEKRYDKMLGETVPEIDGLVLTVVESQITITDTPLMLKLVGIIHEACKKYDKELIVRTFVWHPEELEGVMGAVKELPDDIIIMSKVVPQDWQMRGTDAMEIGRVGNREQIIEYDIAGEYFLMDHVANAFPKILKRQFFYGVKNGVDGICVRVDRWDADVLHIPQEVNLWTLGMLATGEAGCVEKVWQTWATDRYSEKAAPYIIEALKPTERVVTEILNIGPFTFGDTRYFPPTGEDRVFTNNWQNWRWDKSYIPAYKKADVGDAEFTSKVAKQKEKAKRLAEESLASLEKAKPYIDRDEYMLLYTKLLTNKVQLDIRSEMMLSVLKYRRIKNTEDVSTREELACQIRKHLRNIRIEARRVYIEPEEITLHGRTWEVGAPELLERKRINDWTDKVESQLEHLGL